MDSPKDKPLIGGAGAHRPAETPALAPRDVLAYLRAHPNFLNEHPELIPVLTPPVADRGEGVLDMQHFMLQRLREDIRRLKGQQRTLVALSRFNLTSQSRIHAAVLAMLGATSFEQLMQIATTDFAVLLDVDVVTICVETADTAQPRLPVGGIQLLPSGTVDRLLGDKRDARLRANIAGDPMLFGSGAGLVRSDALLRLSVSPHTPTGLLCIGTRRPEKFHPGQGTELLIFLARAFERTIAAWLDLPA